MIKLSVDRKSRLRLKGKFVKATPLGWPRQVVYHYGNKEEAMKLAENGSIFSGTNAYTTGEIYSVTNELRIMPVQYYKIVAC